MPAAPSPLEDLLARRTREGELYEKLPDGPCPMFRLRAPLPRPARRDGICRVRFNEGGTLKVPFGYVGAVHVDPVEKKPFFHALPGARALSFGMLGCDYHCGYCFVPGTEITTTTGARAIDSLFARSETVLETASDAVAVRPRVDVVTHRGRSRAIKGVFRHHYHGPLMVLTLSGGAEIRATPDHEFLVSARAARGVRPPNFFVPASGVTPEFDLLEPTSDGAYRKRRIEDTRVLEYTGPVYNIEVEEDQTYLVQGAAVHNCQNWLTSQALRDPDAVVTPQDVTAGELAALTHRHGARIVTSTYNEPLITSEWAVAVFREARAAGLVCSYVSNGNGTPEVLDYIQPWVSLYKVDLKSFRDRHYRELGGNPGARAVDHPLAARAGHLGRSGHAARAGLQRLGRGADGHRAVPGLGLTRHPLARDRVPQGLQDDGSRGHERAHAAARGGDGRARGAALRLRGQHPGRGRGVEDTRCPSCRAVLIERRGFRVLANRIPDGVCPSCRRGVPGFWEPAAASISGGAITPRPR
jgi:pyruvate formate lyase activating enzyme